MRFLQLHSEATFSWKRGPQVVLVSCVLLFLLAVGGCSIFATRPVQEMSYTVAAIKAAKEVQADTYAPDYFRQASEWFFRAKNEYKFKNFKVAREYALKARRLAEQAEFEAIRSGGIRTEEGGTGDAPEQDHAPEHTSAENAAINEHTPPGRYPNPQGTPAEVYEERKAQDDARKKAEDEAYQKKKDEEEARQKAMSSPLPQGSPFFPQPTVNPPATK